MQREPSNKYYISRSLQDNLAAEDNVRQTAAKNDKFVDICPKKHKRSNIII